MPKAGAVHPIHAGSGNTAAMHAPVPSRNPRHTKLFAAVDVGLKKNKKKHLLERAWAFTFDPQGRFHAIWDVLILVLVFFSAFKTPYYLSFVRGVDKEPWETVLDCAFLFDMVVIFETAYDTGYKLERSKKVIAYRYLKGWFTLDLLSTVDWLGFIEINYNTFQNVGQLDPQTANVLALLRLFKMARLLRVSRLIARLTMGFNTHSTFIEAGKFFLYVIVVAHLLACLFFLVPVYAGNAYTTSWRVSAGLNEMEAGQAYVRCLYWAFTTMTTIGYGDLYPVTFAELIFGVFAEIGGLAVFALLVNQINMVSQVFGSQARVHNQWKDDVIGFIKQAGIEPDQKNKLIDKVRGFLRFKSKSHFHSFTDDDPRFEVLSYALRDEIRRHIFLPALLRIKMFKDEEEQQRMEALVEKLDTDEVKGFIDEEEFQQLSITTGIDMSVDQVRHAMEQMGMDENEMVSVDKFYEWYHLQKYNVPRINFPETFLKILASRLRAMAFSPSDVVVNKGDYGHQLFIVLSGAVHVHKRKYVDVDHKAEGTPSRPASRGSPRPSSKGSAGTGSPVVPNLPLDDLTNPTNTTPLINTPVVPLEDLETARDPINMEGGPEMKHIGDDLAPVPEQQGAVAGEESAVVAIKSHYRYPAFGLVAGLRTQEHIAMRDRTRRWEVRVRGPKENKKDAKVKTGCCDVCYIDRYTLLQLFDSTWDDGPEQVLHFVKYHYNVNFGETDALRINTHDYENRVKVQNLSKQLKVAVAVQEHQIRLEKQKPSDNKLKAIVQQVNHLKQLIKVSCQLTDESLKQMEEQVAKLSNRIAI